MNGEGLGARTPVVRNPVVTGEKAQLAKKLRRRATGTERRAWTMLRNRGCLGLKFRRQQVIGGFVVDFYCAEHRLALEFDGPIHETQREEDRQRDAALSRLNVRIVRIHNEQLSRETLTAAIAVAIPR